MTLMPRPLTRRQREVFDYVALFIQEKGYAPSLEEIGQRFGLSSLATVHKHLSTLQHKGWIHRRWNLSRSTEIVQHYSLDLCPHCLRPMPLEHVS